MKSIYDSKKKGLDDADKTRKGLLHTPASTKVNMNTAASTRRACHVTEQLIYGSTQEAMTAQGLW